MTMPRSPGALFVLGAFLVVLPGGSTLAQETGEAATEPAPAAPEPTPPMAAPQAGGGVVKGTVTAYDEPLSGVRVEVKGTKLSARTNAKGEYALSGLPPGQQTLTARADGFQSQTQGVTVSA